MACAFRNGRELAALISEAMTLVRYSSTGTTFTATRSVPDMMNRRLPENDCCSLRCQWNCTPMVTSSRRIACGPLPRGSTITPSSAAIRPEFPSRITVPPAACAEQGPEITSCFVPAVNAPSSVKRTRGLVKTPTAITGSVTAGLPSTSSVRARAHRTPRAASLSRTSIHAPREAGDARSS